MSPFASYSNTHHIFMFAGGVSVMSLVTKPPPHFKLCGFEFEFDSSLKLEVLKTVFTLNNINMSNV